MQAKQSLHPPQRRFVIHAVPRPHRIDRQVRLETRRDQVERRLQNTDMRFNSADQNAIPVVVLPTFENIAAHTRAKAELIRHVANPLPQLGYRRTKPVRVLLGAGDWNAEGRRRVGPVVGAVAVAPEVEHQM